MLEAGRTASHKPRGKIGAKLLSEESVAKGSPGRLQKPGRSGEGKEGGQEVALPVSKLNIVQLADLWRGEDSLVETQTVAEIRCCSRFQNETP